MSEGDLLIHHLVTQHRPRVQFVDYTLLALRLMTASERPSIRMEWHRRGRIRRTLSPHFHVVVTIHPTKSRANVGVVAVGPFTMPRPLQELHLPERFVRLLQKSAMSAEDVDAVWQYLNTHFPFRLDLGVNYEYHSVQSPRHRLPPSDQLLRRRRSPTRRSPTRRSPTRRSPPPPYVAPSPLPPPSL